MIQNNPKSQTTQILYQEPTQEEMTPRIKLLTRIGDVVALSVIFICLFSLCLIIFKGTADDLEKQAVVSVQHQVGGVK